MPKRTNAQWLTDLRAEGVQRELALAELRQIILTGLPYALSSWLPTKDPRFIPLSDEVTQETLVRVLDRLDTFEGRSQFTTWVHKIAVRIALTELRRKRWENISLDELVDGEESPSVSGLMIDHKAASPEKIVEEADIIRRLKLIIAEELTDKQRQAMMAMAMQGMPLEEIARRMGTNRNALYKLLHDARLRIKRRLEAEGITSDDLLSVFTR